MESRTPRRWPWVLILIGSAAWIGLVVGTTFGATRVPEGSGLAGPAIALGYGVLGAGLLLVLAAVAAWKLPLPGLRIATGAAGLVALALFGLFLWRIADQRAEHRAKIGADVPLPPPAPWRIEAVMDDSVDKRAFREMTVDGSAWRVAWTAVGPERAACSARMVADEATELSAHLSAAPDGPLGDCDLDGRSATHRIEIHEADGAVRTLETDSTCLQRDPYALRLDHLLRRLVLDAVDDARADCDL